MKTHQMAAIAAAFLTLMLTTGCATKKFVRQNVDNLDAKIGGVDKKVDEKTGELDNRVTELDRKTETSISSAQAKADTADQNALKAGKDAQDANALAQKGLTQVGQVDQKVENIDNYQRAKNETVLFKFNKSELTPEAKQQLDSLAQNLATMKHYVIEVKGFADNTGPKEYNLELSRHRADSVVRYLTETRNIPLAKIHILGYGSDNPATADNKREARKLSRRVEVNVLTPPAGTQVSQSQSAPGPG
jgi:outer membrane protein OmpA-like peptidoglycan-associated protein